MDATAYAERALLPRPYRPRSAPERAREGAPWRAIVESLPFPVALLDRDLVTVYASPALVRALGVGPEEAVGLRADSLVRPEDLPTLWAARVDALAGRPTRPVLGITVHGLTRQVECSLALVTDPVGADQPLILASLRDVGAEVEIRHQLGAAHHRNATLLATMSEAVLVVDEHGVVQNVNEQARTLLGYSAEQLLGHDVSVLLQPWDEDGDPIALPTPPIQVPLRAHRPLELWGSILRADGQRVALRVRVAGIPGMTHARPHCALLILEDPVGPRLDDRTIDCREVRSAMGVTPREGQVLDLLAAGLDLASIAERMTISVHSVRGHAKNLMLKLGVHSQVQLVVAAARRGLVDLRG